MDKLVINQRLRVRKDIVTHIRKKLSSSGQWKINVSVGEEVSPEDILGESKASVGFRTVSLARQLGVQPDEGWRYMNKKMGETIYEGELLASKDEILGFRKKIILSPSDGVLDYYDQTRGQLRIKLLPKTTKLASGVLGIVDEIDSKLGTILIRTMSSIVYGVVGTGRERAGILRVMGAADMLVSSKQIVDQLHGTIMVGGALAFGDALQAAVAHGVLGIVSGGINAQDYKTMAAGGGWNIYQKRWSDVGLTVLATEGFGSIPIGEDIFSLLKKYDGKFGVLDGNSRVLILPTHEQDAMMYIRKTRLPIHSSREGHNLQIETVPDIETVELKVGSSVRIVSGQFLGKQGHVEAIDRTPTLLPSGVKVCLVSVVTKSRRIRLPHYNLEAI